MPYTILRPVFFMENLLGVAGAVREGTLAFPLTPDRTLQMIAVDDIGAFAAIAFEHSQKWMGRVLELAGDEMSMKDLAALFSRTLGREVRYTQAPWDEFERSAGPAVTAMWRWFQQTGYHTDNAAVRSEYPRLTTLQRWVQAQDWHLARGAR
jgi:uncharacterized protein YbjT (DUF2867 family)